ncbi:MAG: hypothetical protein QNJ55_22770 [Xenococcus sp. MO_188.B8]|nr:hypothetical protein [Xenococcus sp. MO_188.B8]
MSQISDYDFFSPEVVKLYVFECGRLEFDSIETFGIAENDYTFAEIHPEFGFLG